MSIGNLKTDGGKGTNWPWQYKMLKGLQGIIDIISSTANESEYEAQLVNIDCPDPIVAPAPHAGVKLYLEVRTWDTVSGGFTNISYYLPGSDTAYPAADFAGCTVTYLQSGDATEATLQAILAMNTDIEAKTTLVVANTDTIKADTQDILTKATANETNTAGILADTTAILADTAAIEISNAAIEANTDTVVVTPALSNVITAGTVAAGSRSVSISNVGTEIGTVLGADVPVGVTMTFDAGGLNNTLGAIAYDPTTPGTGTRFLIATTT